MERGDSCPRSRSKSRPRANSCPRSRSKSRPRANSCPRSRSKSRPRANSCPRSRSKSRPRANSHPRSRSRSRSHSKNGDAKRKSDDYGVDTIKITDDDAAFVLGKGGKTKEKIARVAEAEIELFERDLVLEIRGSKQQRRRAKKYCEGVMAQRVGPVTVTEDYDDGDLTMLLVPQEAVGFVTGRAGNFLRTIEEEWCTLMFFCEVGTGSRSRDYEKLAIFGSIRGRRGAELKVLSAVETKVPGYYEKIRDEVLRRDKGKDESETWNTDTMTFQDDELSYALGKQGATRKKLERSSRCIVQYVGHHCFFAGTRPERRRAREYIKWLFDQLEGPVYVNDWEDRDDCVVLDVPSECIGYITGARRATLSQMEEEWGVLMFFMNKGGDRKSGGTEKLIIFGEQRSRRGAELKVMNGIEKKCPGTFSRSVRDKTSDFKGFDTDRMTLKDEELSYAIGKEATTQKKLGMASGAILQFVGNTAYIAGTLIERKRCKDFMSWLLQQMRGVVTIRDVSHRDDCTEVHVPANCKGWVTGNRGSELRRMEQETGVYMFMALDGHGEERLLIFGTEPGSKTSSKGRLAAERLVNDMVQEKLKGDGGRGRSNSRSPSRYGGGGRGRSCSRRRSRSPPRRRSPSRRKRSDSRRRTPPRRSPSRRADQRRRSDSRRRR